MLEVISYHLAFIVTPNNVHKSSHQSTTSLKCISSLSSSPFNSKLSLRLGPYCFQFANLPSCLPMLSTTLKNQNECLKYFLEQNPFPRHCKNFFGQFMYLLNVKKKTLNMFF
jgi:hypothetical protein